MATTEPSWALGGGSLLPPVRKNIGALAATLDGLGTLVFSGGIGARVAAVRERVCQGGRSPRHLCPLA